MLAEAMYRIEISVSKKAAEERKEPFRIISEHINIVDIPGIEDGHHSVPIKAYIEQFSEKIIPVVLINLT